MDLKILHADGVVKIGNLDISQTTERPPNCRLVFSSPRRDALAFENSDFFECLIDLRRVLEEEGAKPLCHGARRDVFPSPMQRRTGGGLRAYQQRLGEKASEQDVVETFGEVDAEIIASVDEQRVFHEEWLVSLGWYKTRGGNWFMTDPSKTPTPGEIEEAKRFPNGTVSRIGGGYAADEAVPREAIEGCWEVSETGEIVGHFLKNPYYDPSVVRN